jgi:hypothetical protein
MKCHFPLAAALLLGVGGVFAADEAVVKGNRINVRGQPNTGSEVVTQFKQGEKLLVLEEIVHPKPAKGEPAKWLRVALPANTPVWVNTLFITNGVVAAPRLNIRSGPGENFSVLGRITRGTQLKELRRNGDWLEIEAPANTFAYVAADLVTRKAPAAPAPGPVPIATGAQLAGSKTPAAPVPPTKAGSKATAKATPRSPITAPSTPPSFEPVEIKPITTPPVALPPGRPAVPPPVPQPPVVVAAVPPPALVSTPAPVPPPAPIVPEVKPEPPKVAPPSALTENVPPVPDPLESTGRYRIEPEPKKGFGNWFRGLFAGKSDAPRPAAAKKAADAQPVDEGPAPLRIVTREGVVARSWNIQTPSDWALQDPDSGRVINYLWSTSTNIPWKTLKGRTIVVTGEEALDVRWPQTPVLRIETLKTVED